MFSGWPPNGDCTHPSIRGTIPCSRRAAPISVVGQGCIGVTSTDTARFTLVDCSINRLAPRHRSLDTYDHHVVVGSHDYTIACFGLVVKCLLRIVLSPDGSRSAFRRAARVLHTRQQFIFPTASGSHARRPWPLDAPPSGSALQSHRIDLFDMPEQVCYCGHAMACGQAGAPGLADDPGSHSICGTARLPPR